MENKVKVWLARCKDGDLFIYSSAPFKGECIWSPQSTNINTMELKSDKFPTVKWEDDEPTEAYITLAETQEQSKQEQEQQTPKQEIDWEQRRYEIAKDMLPVIYKHAMEAQKHGQSVKRKDTADFAVAFADVLIKKLKEKSE